MGKKENKPTPVVLIVVSIVAILIAVFFIARTVKGRGSGANPYGGTDPSVMRQYGGPPAS